MANLFDYLEWRGDIPICKEVPFCELDGMVLARFAYLPFDKVTLRDDETVGSFWTKIEDFADSEYKLDGDRDLIKWMAAGARFRDMVFTDYVQDISKNDERQFSAVTIHIDADHLYISFCGTDSTLLGWKEDFNMSFMYNVSGQVAAVDYAKMITEKYPTQKLRIGGHSKGGNLAVYSATLLPPETQQRIEKVCNYDGPGFPEEFIQKPGYNAIIDKIHTYIPQDSVFGRLLEHGESLEVVKSTGNTIYQHNTYTWEVMADHLIRLEAPTDASNFNRQSLRRVLEITTPEERMLFLDTVYDAVTSSNESARTFSDIKNSLLTSLPKFVYTMGTLTETQRKNIYTILTDFAKAYWEVFAENTASRLLPLGNVSPIQVNPVDESGTVEYMNRKDKDSIKEQILKEAQEADELKAETWTSNPIQMVAPYAKRYLVTKKDPEPAPEPESKKQKKKAKKKAKKQARKETKKAKKQEKKSKNQAPTRPTPKSNEHDYEI